MDNILTRSQRAKRFKLSAVEEGTFETLPVDIFHLLFPYLEPHDRLSLSITSKTMHAIDRLIGGWKVQNFDKIEANSFRMLDELSIKTMPSAKKPSNIKIPITNRCGKSEGIIFRNAGIFQRASASILDVYISGLCQMNALSFIFAFTQFKQLKARVNDGSFTSDALLNPLPQSDSGTRFLATLLKRQTQSDIEVDIEWKNCDHSFSVFREAIKELVSLRKIRLDWQLMQDDYSNREYPINNDSLRNLVKITRECSVGLGNISARCILDVFEICYNSTDREKKVELLTEEWTIADLRRLVRASTHLGYYWEHNERDSRLRRGDGQNCTCAIIEEPPFYPGGAQFNQSRGEGYPYRRVTISRVPPLWNARRTAY